MGINKKNKAYYQLASKDFKTSVQLKFYCFHQQVLSNAYHYFTCAPYTHTIDQIPLDSDIYILIEESHS